MNLLTTQLRIATLLTNFVQNVKVLNAMERYDINRISQTVLVPLFREVYDLPRLRNLDDELANYPSVDLGDDEKRVAFQVTSNANSNKIKVCLRTFMDRKLFKDYDQVYVYCLTEKLDRYTSSGFDKIIDGKVLFDKSKDILDYTDIAKVVKRFQIDKAERVLDILEQNFGQPRARAQVEINEARAFLGWYPMRDHSGKEGPQKDHFTVDARISFTAADVNPVILHAERCRAFITIDGGAPDPVLKQDFKMFSLPRGDGGNHHEVQLTFTGKKSFSIFGDYVILDEGVADRLREGMNKARLHVEVMPIGSSQFVSGSVLLPLERPVIKDEDRFWIHWLYEMK